MGNHGLLRLVGLLAALILASPQPGAAHPLGNFSISQYTGIHIADESIALRYFVDMAEIPAFQELQAREIPADPADPRVSRYLRETTETLKRGLVLEVDGRRLVLDVKSTDIIFPPGAGDLPTLKLAILLKAPLGERQRDAAQDLRYRDENFAARAGWKEVVAVASSGSRIVESSVPERDRSRELGDYATDLLDSPPQVREARLRFTRPASTVVASSPSPPATTLTAASSSKPATISAPGAASDARSTSVLDPTSGSASASAATPEAATPQDAPIAPKANVQGATRSTFTDLIATRELTVSVIAVALIVAAVLGAFHALEPGHGKTVVAAYLVGSRGTARHALILGLIVTASHTAGVYLLGGVTFFASQYVVPDRLYPWVALASGLTIAGLGFSLLWRRLRGGPAAHEHHHHHHGHDGHAHPHGPHDHHDHEHHDHAHAHDHAHGHGHHHHHEPGAVSLRQLWALGITGGIVPCPAALVVLLSALSLRRVGFGLLLIVAFSVGLALVLIAIGMLMVYARRLVARFDERGPLVTRWLPLASSAVMTLIGVSIAAQALTSGIMPWKLT